jgi:hypothetical protein
MTERRQSKSASVARAGRRGGKSGGGASDPGVVDLISRIAGEGSYRSQLALYEGQRCRARPCSMRGEAARYEGKARRSAAGFANAFGTALKGASTSLFEKYGRKIALQARATSAALTPYFRCGTWGMT